MSRIMIIGGHGKVARHLSRLLCQDGHQVTSVIRSDEQVPDVDITGANAVVRDVQESDTQALRQLFAGQDAVVWSAGAGGGNPQRTYAVDRDAAIRSMDAAREAGVKHYVMVSYLGAGLNHGVAQDHDFYPYAQSKAQADAHLRDSSLNWTILGPGKLTDENPSGKIHMGPRPHGDENLTSRANVAEVALWVLENPQTASRRTVEFSDGETPISQALAATH